MSGQKKNNPEISPKRFRVVSAVLFQFSFSCAVSLTVRCERPLNVLMF